MVVVVVVCGCCCGVVVVLFVCCCGVVVVLLLNGSCCCNCCCGLAIFFVVVVCFLFCSNENCHFSSGKTLWLLIFLWKETHLEIVWISLKKVTTTTVCVVEIV